MNEKLYETKRKRVLWTRKPIRYGYKYVKLAH